MEPREGADRALDWIRFQVDRRRAYQPLPWLGIDAGSRDVGMDSRWAAIAEIVREFRPRTALDIGCNAGYFTLALAEEGLAVVGVDLDPRFLRLLQRAVAQTQAAVGVMNLRVGPQTCQLLPTVDLTLHLAVWHHDVRTYGIDDATAILESVWHRTRQVLVFETGEKEMSPAYGLPDMGDEPGAFLADYLASVCAGGEVRSLGRHEARPHGVVVERNVLAVVRR